MKRKQDTVFGGMHVSFYIYVSEVHCALKRWHCVFWRVARAATVSKGDGRIMFEKGMFH
jgi:hypothetical protein